VESKRLKEVVRVDQVILDNEILLDISSEIKSLPGKVFETTDQSHYGHSTAIMHIKDEQEAGLIRSYFSMALDVINQTSPFFKELLPEIVDCIIPISETGVFQSKRSAFSFYLFKGALFHAVPDTSRPNWKIDLSIDIAHEIGHQALMVYQSTDRIISSDLNAPIYSQIRKTERPVIMSYHACVALSYMTRFLMDFAANARDLVSIGEYQYGCERLEEYRAGLSLGILDLNKACNFTDIGRMQINELSAIACG
jgi:hypothetical protein